MPRETTQVAHEDLQVTETSDRHAAWVYWSALALRLVLSIEKAFSDSWSFNGQNIAAFALFFYGIQGLGKYTAQEAAGEQN